MHIRRIPDNPIITPDSHPSVGTNINGPSLLRKPQWVEAIPGKYLLYFAHHSGDFIRLASADSLEGPWKVYPPGTLQLEQTPFNLHIASPDVHVDEARQEMRMYYHGSVDGEQFTCAAHSRDGVRFESDCERLGPSYFRVWQYSGWWYALAMPGLLFRSRDGLHAFEPGPRLFNGPVQRHTAVRLVLPDTLEVYYSNIGDTPERILRAKVLLEGDWQQWRPSKPEEVLAPEMDYEGAEYELRPSVLGWAPHPIRQLRDPAVFEEDERLWLAYAVAGEQGIALAELAED